ncbi:hypothetical protein [Mycoplasma sp. 3398]
MKLKYILISEQEGEILSKVETDFVDFKESNSTEFTHIEFTDEKVMDCILDIKNDEVRISYAGQYLEMKQNEFVPNKLIVSFDPKNNTNNIQQIHIDIYLIETKISNKEISFMYDILQSKKILVRNTVKLVFE